MTDNTNSTATDLGIRAAQAWDRSSNNGDAGDALAICAMFGACQTMTFSASVTRKGSDIAETIDFDMQTWSRPRFNADGSKDIKAMAACTTAVASKLFGLDALDNAIKQRIERAKRAALYLYDNIPADQISIVTMKGNKLVVPYGMVHKAPTDDASDNDKTVYEAMSSKPCTLDGKNGASLAELGKRARPQTDKRAAHSNDKPDAGKMFSESLSHVLAIMLQQVAEDGEPAVALDNALRLRLADLNVTLSRYFTDDPIEDSSDKRKAA